MNATHFFEKSTGDRSLPQSSESFWTAVFALFLLHLARNDDDISLPVWEPMSQRKPPWYKRKPAASALRVHGLSFDGVAVEPNTIMGIWPHIIHDIRIGGISPDVVISLPQEAQPNPNFILIENKITSGATLNANQLSIYPEVVSRLWKKDINARLLVLQSVGCDQRLYDATKELQRELSDRFGILLWEDVFRLMGRTRFNLLGFDPTIILQVYTEAARTDCLEWEVE